MTQPTEAPVLPAGIFSRFGSRYFTFLPGFSRPRTFRQRMADAVFLFFAALARFGFLIGGLVSRFLMTVESWLPGVLVGVAAGLLIRRSLGLKGRNPTHSFFVRAWERANGGSPRLLEWFIERLRGGVLTLRQCRALSSAYAECQRELQSCPSETERRRIHRELDRKVSAVLYGGAILPPSAPEVPDPVGTEAGASEAA